MYCKILVLGETTKLLVLAWKRCHECPSWHYFLGGSILEEIKDVAEYFEKKRQIEGYLDKIDFVVRHEISGSTNGLFRGYVYLRKRVLLDREVKTIGAIERYLAMKYMFTPTYLWETGEVVRSFNF